MECNKEKNMEDCNCTFSCDKKGVCCECLRSHLAQKQLPACCFPDSVACTDERSFEKFIEINS